MIEELKPCFSCGSEAVWCGSRIILDDDDMDWKHDCHQIRCTKCGIQFDANNKVTQTVDTMPALREEMARLWNKRA